MTAATTVFSADGPVGQLLQSRRAAAEERGRCQRFGEAVLLRARDESRTLNPSEDAEFRMWMEAVRFFGGYISSVDERVERVTVEEADDGIRSIQ